MESASLSQHTIDAQGALHQLDQALADGETETRTAVVPRRRCFCLRKTFEDALAMLGRDARSVSRMANAITGVPTSLLNS